MTFILLTFSVLHKVGCATQDTQSSLATTQSQEDNSRQSFLLSKVTSH